MVPHLGLDVAAVLPVEDGADDRLTDPQIRERSCATVGEQDRRVATRTEHAGVRASPVRIDGPAERHLRRLGHAVEGGFGADLVEADVHRLGCVEAADDRGVAVAGEAGLLLPVAIESQVVPAHDERMFAEPADGMAPLVAAPTAARPRPQPPTRASSDISPASVCAVALGISTGTMSPG